MTLARATDDAYGTGVTDRIVRDVCIEFARNTTSKVERAVLLTLAFFAERDAGIERVERPKSQDIARLEQLHAEHAAFTERCIAEAKAMMPRAPAEPTPEKAAGSN